MLKQMLTTKSFDNISSEHKSSQLKRILGPWQLALLGVGCTIGTGIFVLTGQEAAIHAGPAIVISFIISGLGCLFAGLCYAEFAAMIPIAGSAYQHGGDVLAGSPKVHAALLAAFAPHIPATVETA